MPKKKSVSKETPVFDMSDHSSDSEEELVGDLFGTEEETAPEPEPTFEVYARNPLYIKDDDTPKELKIRLVGSHPLWAHHLWNASKVFASMFDEHPSLCRDKTVLELGAGGALPSLVASLYATKVVVTDYPDDELIDNIRYNISSNLGDRSNIVADGYVWGTATDKLREHLPPNHTTYDVIILSDLVFNHSQHHALLRTCRELLTPKTGRVYVFYTHHRPHLAHKDLEFFEIAQRPVLENVDPDDRELLGYGLKADHFVKKKMHVMFEEDPGDEEVRATVHGWQLWLP
ncbi:putative methyltransferase-domain-containing protein [Radiomyces spectabilis]|uniref:putative methyltransferase-domain-containing protein n=1 Tax=Radiomyces spectabilis TaxID=64574 RepID=UPI00221FE802|nr:putative methyltransferase-domain-containing protein [Radiomyces spectabilis]KAI8370398.1 putative methyltransferase-domain-containing protein [Radiomyces spectabilis]